MTREKLVTVTYEFLSEGSSKTGTWRGPREVALATAVDKLDAVELEEGEYLYQASAAEGGGYYVVTDDDLVTLGTGYLAGATDHYSLWCASCGREATESEISAALA